MQMLNYETDGSVKHTGGGLFEQALVGGFAGFTGGGVAEFGDAAGASALVKGIASMGAGWAAGAETYNSLTPPDQRTSPDFQASGLVGAASALPTDSEFWSVPLF